MVAVAHDDAPKRANLMCNELIIRLIRYVVTNRCKRNVEPKWQRITTSWLVKY